MPEKIKEIFIPDTEKLKASFDNLFTDLRAKFGLDSVEDSFTGIFDNERPMTDIQGTLNLPGIGSIRGTFFDASFFVDGVEYFRPILRGFMIFYIVLFNIRKALAFTGQEDGGAE